MKGYNYYLLCATHLRAIILARIMSNFYPSRNSIHYMNPLSVVITVAIQNNKLLFIKRVLASKKAKYIEPIVRKIQFRQSSSLLTFGLWLIWEHLFAAQANSFSPIPLISLTQPAFGMSMFPGTAEGLRFPRPGKASFWF